jgi:hypothetical protein
MASSFVPAESTYLPYYEAARGGRNDNLSAIPGSAERLLGRKRFAHQPAEQALGVPGKTGRCRFDALARPFFARAARTPGFLLFFRLG